MELSRRKFLLLGAAAGVTLAIPVKTLPIRVKPSIVLENLQAIRFEVVSESPVKFYPLIKEEISPFTRLEITFSQELATVPDYSGWVRRIAVGSRTCQISGEVKANKEFIRSLIQSEPNQIGFNTPHGFFSGAFLLTELELMGS